MVSKLGVSKRDIFQQPICYNSVLVDFVVINRMC